MRPRSWTPFGDRSKDSKCALLGESRSCLRKAAGSSAKSPAPFNFVAVIDPENPGAGLQFPNAYFTGNPDLVPELSRNLSAGFDWTPSGVLDGFALQVTFTDIDIRDRIGSITSIAFSTPEQLFDLPGVVERGPEGGIARLKSQIPQHRHPPEPLPGHRRKLRFRHRRGHLQGGRGRHVYGLSPPSGGARWLSNIPTRHGRRARTGESQGRSWMSNATRSVYACRPTIQPATTTPPPGRR